MTEDFRKGDAVRWKSPAGEAHGHVVKKITKPVTIKGNKMAASKDNPEFLVETDSGKRAAHKFWALKKQS